MKIAGSTALAVALYLCTQAHAQQKSAAPDVEVGFVVLNVSDMDKSLAFYKLVGFTPSMERGEKPKRAVAMNTDPARGTGGLVLIEQPGKRELGNGLSRVGIRTADAVALCKRLSAAGTPCTREPRVVPQDQGAIIGWAVDPDGYNLEIVQMPK